MNRLELRLALQERIKVSPDDSGNVRVTDTEANEYLDDGYVDLAERAGIIPRTVTIAAGANEHFVDLPENCIYPIAMRDVATGHPIDPSDWLQIDNDCPIFIRLTDTYPRAAAGWGLAELLLSRAYGTAGSFELIYAAVPDPMADGTTPEFPVQHHMALVYYAHMRVLLKDAHGDLAGPRLGRAARQRRNYLELALLLNKWAIDRHGARAMVMGTQSLRKVESPSSQEIL